MSIAGEMGAAICPSCHKNIPTLFRSATERRFAKHDCTGTTTYGRLAGYPRTTSRTRPGANQPRVVEVTNQPLRPLGLRKRKLRAPERTLRGLQSGGRNGSGVGSPQGAGRKAVSKTTSRPKQASGGNGRVLTDYERDYTRAMRKYTPFWEPPF